MVLAVTGHGQLHSDSQAQQAWKWSKNSCPWCDFQIIPSAWIKPTPPPPPQKQFFILSYTVQHILESVEFAYHGPDVYPMRPKGQKCWQCIGGNEMTSVSVSPRWARSTQVAWRMGNLSWLWPEKERRAREREMRAASLALRVWGGAQSQQVQAAPASCRRQ